MVFLGNRFKLHPVTSLVRVGKNEVVSSLGKTPECPCEKFSFSLSPLKDTNEYSVWFLISNPLLIMSLSFFFFFFLEEKGEMYSR